MKKITNIFVIALLVISCGVLKTERSFQGRNDEEKQHNKAKYHFDEKNYMRSYSVIEAFREKYPKSGYRCEMNEMMGDIRLQQEYFKIAITEYKKALKRCSGKKKIAKIKDKLLKSKELLKEEEND